MEGRTGSRRAGRVPVAERGPGRSYRPDGRPPSLFREHQPGIATPQLDHLLLAAYDLPAPGRLRDLLVAWTEEAERLMRARRSGLTLTLGLGPGAFGGELRDLRPLALAELPPFPGDALDPELCGGDVCVQACADEPGAAVESLRALERVASGAITPRWSRPGFLARRQGRRFAHDVLGFTDGTNNVRRGLELDRHVWARERERTWMRNGTFLVVRQIRVRMEEWERLPVAEQERTIGRQKGSGAALGASRLFDKPPLEAAGPDGPLIPADAHVRLAAPASNGGIAMLRRGYSYDDGVDHAGERDSGLVFLAFQRDPRRQYVPIQRRLAEHDALSRYTRHVGSAVFAIPPGARPGGFLAEGLWAGN